MRTLSMKMNNLLLFLFLGLQLPLFSITLEEKKSQLVSQKTPKEQDNQELAEIDMQLREKRNKALSLQNELWEMPQSEKDSKSPAYLTLSKEMLALQKEIFALQNEWRTLSVQQENAEFESVWHLPETTIGQLVIDYNPGDCIYSMSPEISQLKIHISSHISVPRGAWGQMLELILANSGIGIKPLGPFIKQLYFMRLNQSGLTSFLDDREELACFNPEQKIAFVLTPPATEVRRVHQFLEKFTPQEQMAIQTLSSSIVIIGLVKEVQEILKIYDFITSPKHCQDFRLVALEKSDSTEMAQILTSIFENEGVRGSDGFMGRDKPMPFFSQQESSSGFRVLPLKHPASSLFLIGRPDQLEKAVAIIKEIETNIGEVQEKSVFWYACKHSESEDLAKVLNQVYHQLIASSIQAPSNGTGKSQKKGQQSLPREEIIVKRDAYPGATPKDSLIVSPSMVTPGETNKQSTPTGLGEHFIVDPKTNSIIMVVEKYVLPKLKELLVTLDVPKKMVQIDVLLFEKKITDGSSIGLSLLKLGENASKKRIDGGITWNDLGHRSNRDNGNNKNYNSRSHSHSSRHSSHSRDNGDYSDSSRGGSMIQETAGILQYALSHGSHSGFPAYELAYQFLLSQEDIQINANPSVTTVNQTAAKIAIVDQISINTGAVEFDRDHFKDAYSRAEYGIILQITPTVYAKIEDDSLEPKFITLATDVTFDTTHNASGHDRPDVTRRNIKNEVRVRDGETVILGGLRRKDLRGGKQSIPFLGELPGIGFLFSHSESHGLNTEMFIFLTPHILPDSQEEWKRERTRELMRRPGDTPEFFKEIDEAKHQKKRSLFEESIKLFFVPNSIAQEKL